MMSPTKFMPENLSFYSASLKNRCKGTAFCPFVQSLFVRICVLGVSIFAVAKTAFLEVAQKAPFHSLKIGLSHTYGGGVTQTCGRGVTQTDFEDLKGGAFRVL